MQIKSTDTIAGVSILAIRKLMRKGRDSSWNILFIKETLNISKVKAKILIDELLSQQYIEADGEDEGLQYWKTTLLGNQLALASAAKPIKRETADKKVNEFLNRAHEVNSNDNYLYYVNRACLFGSYLSSNEKLGDLDILVELLPKHSDRDKQQKLERLKIKQAIEYGKNFSYFVQELFWPYEEVLRFLKNRSRSISLHSKLDEGLNTDFKEIFKYE
jgi:predicted nucleotidyltransferase